MHETIRMEPVTANRAPAVSILDFRFDKSFRFGRFGRLTRNGRHVQPDEREHRHNVPTAMGATFNEVIGILDPRIVRFGVRYDF